MKRYLIIAGGEYDEDILSKLDSPFDHITACDRGLIYCERMGIVPDLVIGDMDSVPTTTVFDENTVYFGDRQIPLMKHPVQKDDTDTMLAVRHALDNDFMDITVCNGFGGRLDHSIANIQTGAFIAKKGGICTIHGTDTTCIIFSDSGISISPDRASHLSVFSLTDISKDVSITGTAYELHHGVLTGDFPLGVSNSPSPAASSPCRISVGEGILMVIIAKRELS